MTMTPFRLALLVKDNRGDPCLLREMLNERGPAGTELRQVDTLIAAENYLADDAVDIILLDLGLPDAQGVAVRSIHAAAPHIAPGVLTALDNVTLATQALQEGARDISSRVSRHPRTDAFYALCH